MLKRKTAKDRLRQTLMAINRWCGVHRHASVAEQHPMLASKLRGHCAYYGITGNASSLSTCSFHVVHRTPTTGEERRRFLNERAREGREKVSVAAQRGREFVQQQREHLSTAIDRGREAYQRDREGNNDDAEEQGSRRDEPERTQDTPSPTKSGKSEE